MPDPELLRERLRRRMTGTCKRFELLEEGDRVLVAVSGGKDSYTLLDLLAASRLRSPFRFDLVAVHLDQMQPGYDGGPLLAWLADFGTPYEIIQRDTYSQVRRITKGSGTYCAPCSRMRRGILYDAAGRLGCNKLALGHHRDDAIETFLLNVFYQGRIGAMPAKYRTHSGRFEVIRPLIECAEQDIALHAQHAGYPILPCNLCGGQSGLRRDAMTQLIDRIEADHPEVRNVMLASLQNVQTTHLLDARLLDIQLRALGEEAQ